MFRVSLSWPRGRWQSLVLVPWLVLLVARPGCACRHPSQSGRVLTRSNIWNPDDFQYIISIIIVPVPQAGMYHISESHASSALRHMPSSPILGYIEYH